jgi:hypothetical protein
MSDMVIMPDETETCRVCGDTFKFKDALNAPLANPILTDVTSVDSPASRWI